MNDNLKEMFNNIPIPDELDERIELGFKEARKESAPKVNIYKKYLVGFVAALVVIALSVVAIGPDKVHAAIQKALQYIPGFNQVIEKEEGQVLILKEEVNYKGKGHYFKIKAAALIDNKFNVSIESDYLNKEEKLNLAKDMEIYLQDSKGKQYKAEKWMIAGGGDHWNSDLYFNVDETFMDYTLVIDKNNMAISLEQSTSAEDFFQFGNHASDKGIDIVALKKETEDGLIISLLNQTKDNRVIGYPFEEDLNYSIYTDIENSFEKTMYIIDKDGNKTYPTIPKSFSNMLSDFNFIIEKKEGLKLVLPYIKIDHSDIKSEKLNILIPSEGNTQNIGKEIKFGKFFINVKDVKNIDGQIFISCKLINPKDEKFDLMSLDIKKGYGIQLNEKTGTIDIVIDRKDFGRDLTFSLEDLESILFGNWTIPLDNKK